MLSVQGTCHQADTRFRGTGRQCVANSAAAMMYAMEKSPVSWKSNDIDNILDMGDNLFTKIGVNKYLLISELPKKVGPWSFSILNSCSGTLTAQLSEGPFYCLKDAVSTIEQFAFLTIDCFTMAIISFDSKLYVFDSHSRDSSGMSSPDGSAILTTHNSLQSACLFLSNFTKKLFPDFQVFPGKLFEVTHVSVKKIPLYDSFFSDSSSDEFSGFSEISEGEVSCRMYIAQELLDNKLNLSNEHNAQSDSSDDIPLSVLKHRYLPDKDEVISEPELSFSETCSSGSEYKFTSFERKLLENEISSSDIISSDSDAHAKILKGKFLKKKKAKKSLKGKHKSTKTSTPKIDLCKTTIPRRLKKKTNFLVTSLHTSAKIDVGSEIMVGTVKESSVGSGEMVADEDKAITEVRRDAGVMVANRDETKTWVSRDAGEMVARGFGVEMGVSMDAGEIVASRVDNETEESMGFRELLVSDVDNQTGVSMVASEIVASRVEAKMLSVGACEIEASRNETATEISTLAGEMVANEVDVEMGVNLSASEMMASEFDMELGINMGACDLVASEVDVETEINIGFSEIVTDGDDIETGVSMCNSKMMASGDAETELSISASKLDIEKGAGEIVESIVGIETGLSVIADETLASGVVEMEISMIAGEIVASSVDVRKDSRGSSEIVASSVESVKELCMDGSEMVANSVDSVKELNIGADKIVASSVDVEKDVSMGPDEILASSIDNESNKGNGIDSGSCLDDSMTETFVEDGLTSQISGKEYRGRKRKRNPEQWKRCVLKRQRNTGEEYINEKGVKKPAKCIKPGCGAKCRFKCHLLINQEVRENIFHKFWSLGDVTPQRQFILKHSEPKPKGHKTVTGNSRRSYSFSYSLPCHDTSVRVCKSFFLDTLNITGQRVQTAFKKSVQLPGVSSPDKRGKHHSRPNKTPDHQVMFVKKHIDSFPKVESHYCRKDTKKMYLCPGLSVPKMYALYTEQCAIDHVEAVSLNVYRSIFDNHFNLSFFKPIKDQCDICNAYNSNSESLSNDDRAILESHLKNKQAAREHKEADKLKAVSQQDEDFIASCFDLEEVLLTPKGFESSLYYKRRLNTYNFSVYDLGTRHAQCYLWDESVSGRGACEVASCVYSYIKDMADRGKKKFVFFSDNCGSQNKNKYYISMLWFALQKFNLDSIEHKYMEKGHTQNENDSVHASVENASRHVSVYTPSQWAAIIRTARPKSPYLVKEMDATCFFDFKKIAGLLKNFDLDSDRQKVYWSEVRKFSIMSEDPNTVFFQYDYDGPVNRISLVHRLRKNHVIENPRSIPLVRLHTEPIPIDKDKYRDLVALCSSGIIPRAHHLYYLLLPHDNV